MLIKRKILSLFFLIAAFLFLQTNQKILRNTNFTVYKHPITPNGSRCLDGSPSAIAYYIGQEKDKFLVYFQGGGLCAGISQNQVLESCLQRSSSFLGSSSLYPSSYSFESKYAFLSSDPKVNPNFYSWSKAYFPYCDGTAHQGHVSQPISVNGKDLYFRGDQNTKTNFEFLKNNFNFFNKKKIVIAGLSAGGIASMIWSNYVYNLATYKNNILVLPDAGIFLGSFVHPILNIPILNSVALIVASIVNKEITNPLNQCVQKYPTQVQCINAKFLLPFLKSKVFIIESQYDTNSFKYILAIDNTNCVTQRKPSPLSKCSSAQISLIQAYRKQVVQFLINFTKTGKNGVWAVSCALHSFNFPDTRVPSSKNFLVNGHTINQAIAGFLAGRSRVFIDKVPWPKNKGCNGQCSKNCISTQCVDGICKQCQAGYHLTDINLCVRTNSQ